MKRKVQMHKCVCLYAWTSVSTLGNSNRISIKNNFFYPHDFVSWPQTYLLRLIFLHLWTWTGEKVIFTHMIPTEALLYPHLSTDYETKERLLLNKTFNTIQNHVLWNLRVSCFRLLSGFLWATLTLSVERERQFLPFDNYFVY